MLITEYRQPLPMTLNEYELGQRYAFARAKEQEGIVEHVEERRFSNVPLFGGKFTKGQYTYNVYHIRERAPNFLKKLIPKKFIKVYEETWLAYPYSKSIMKNSFVKDFFIETECIIVENNIGDIENIFQLSNEELKKRQVVMIDFVKDALPKDWLEGLPCDVSSHVSHKANRGPLKGEWWKTQKPISTAYRLARVKFKMFAVQDKLENLVDNNLRLLYTKFGKQVFCWMDEWYNINPPELAKIEGQMCEELKHKIQERKSNYSGSETRTTGESSSDLGPCWVFYYCLFCKPSQHGARKCNLSQRLRRKK